MYPTITAIARHRRPKLRDEDYYDLFEESQPIDTSRWRTHAKDHPPRPAERKSRYPEMPEDQDDRPGKIKNSRYPRLPEDDQ